ncbi:MAG: glutamate-5-semialdehyde dehydrogenase [Alphaproteobacteria bacterium]|nr:glutamate-5-semialdehyde dehydrogenase [Alphaproteobacteria bacterium]
MNARGTPKDNGGSPALEAAIAALARDARAAALRLATTPTEAKRAALKAAAASLRRNATNVLDANARDVAAAGCNDISGAMLDRLVLDQKRLDAMIAGLEEVAALPDPVGRVLESWTRPNGLRIERVAVPIGVIGIIYESRPNVTADAGSLCLMAGNAAILRGGSESFESSKAIVACLADGLRAAGLPEAAIQLVPTTDRAAVGALLRLAKDVDLIVPRGGRSLIERVQAESRIPVLAHLDGLCHVYVHAAADLDMAKAVLLNSKMRRTGVCNAAESLLIDRAIVTRVGELIQPLLAAGCEVRGDETFVAADRRVKPAAPIDYDTEFLDAIIAAKVVSGPDEAIAHVNQHGSHHTDSIVTNDDAIAERFLNEVDSGVVLHNASTQFNDGGQFGMGAEIGISTSKLHARGPVGVEQLTTFKYRVRGAGQLRP